MVPAWDGLRRRPATGTSHIVRADEFEVREPSNPIRFGAELSGHSYLHPPREQHY